MLSIGDVLSLVVMDAFMKASVQANDAFVLFAVIFLVSGLLQHVSVGEVETNREREDTSIGDYMAETVVGLRTFLSSPRNSLWFCCNLLLDNFFYCSLLWMPFYFSQLGFAGHSSLISLMFPLLGMLSVLIVNYLFRYCERQTQHIVLGFNILTIGLEIALIILGDDESLVPVYATIVAGVGAFFGPGFAIAYGSEVAELTEGSPRLRNQVFFFEALARQVLIFVSMIVIGMLMEESTFGLMKTSSISCTS